ncbi:protein suppressor 2 of zeste [Drosophila innubila]|uniref:protein suppressor 2 of zeste n=1 Tax=Drosophila innubila TaxID=198719 RepID=UPI00148B5918|nr:protein suppressor 2 of zeste [Drosophila innubila]
MQLKSETTHKKISSEMENTQTTGFRRDLGEFNDLLTCRICLGYMIDPTTVDYCYHTYCRSCILKHLLRDVYCPQCKGSGGKQITEDNLRSDDTLRALIYKMVPGLYQRECDRLVEFEEQHKELDAEDVLKTDKEQEFFTPAEPISLSLEYHPAMLKHCRASDKPPVCYLQCPAGLRVMHLKQFLCSKYDIDAQNKQVEVEVTYEDEVLPPTLTLMDVGYCYHWQRHAPMSFQYRILLYENETTKNDENNLSKVNQDIELRPAVAATKSGKSVTFADEVDTQFPARTPPQKTRSKSSTKVNKSKRVTQVTLPGKRESSAEEAAQSLSNFKSLRSNDMRYSDYGVTSTPLLRVKSEPEAEEPSSLGVSNMNIVVSIPQSQLSKSAGYADEEGFELKTANRKNLPKLKIELTSMKAKLTMPKSADARLEDVQQQLDLETYAKNIGLKPIEPAAIATTAVTPVTPVTPATPLAEALKYSPNASPMSSCSSSTNGSNGTSNSASSTTSSSSSHRKRKKKHSKEPKDANGKRKKLHAEISSQTDGKMKMKITTTHNHKAHKLDLKRSHSLAGGEIAALNQLKLVEEQVQRKESESLNVLNRTLGEEARSINNLMTAGNSMNSTDKRAGNLPASPPLPPSLFKSFAPASNQLPKAATPPLQAAATAIAATAAKSKLTAPQKSIKQPIMSHINRKPSLTPCASPNANSNAMLLTATATATATPHFAVPQAPLIRQAPHQMLRYLSTPSSIASAANKQPKRTLSLDEQQQQQQLLAKQPRLDYQQQLAAKLKAGQMRLYGPDLSKPTNMPMLCPTSYSPPTTATATIGGGSVTITPRQRNTTAMHGLSYPYNESNSLNSLPALEIVRLGATTTTAAATAAATATTTALATATGRLMGPPKQPAAKRATVAQTAAMPLPLPLPMPAIVKSPPLSVALSAQRGNSNNNNNNQRNHSNNNNNNNNNAAYRTSPPALINLRSFPSKSAAKVELNSKKSATTAIAAGAAATATTTTTGKTNGTTLLDKSKTSLRDFRPPFVAAAAATTTAKTNVAASTTTAAKDADNILDLSAGTGRKTATTTATTAAATSSSNSLEAALNKIKQNISANNNNNCTVAAAAAAAAAGDDLQNLHMLSESATAREKISIKAGNSNNNNSNSSNKNSSNNNNSSSNNKNNSSNIYENKPKNALVRPQNASVRSIPNPSALAFRNQATLLTSNNSSNNSSTTTTATATVAANTATAASIAAKPLTVKAEEKSKLSTATMCLSPNNNNNNSSSNNNNNNSNAATSPRATKKATTIDQVAANLNIRAEAKAAALAEEAPPSSVASVANVVAAKTPDLEKLPSSNNLLKTDVKESTAATTTAATATTTATTTAATTAATTTTVSAVNVNVSDALSKPPVQISATDTPVPVASSA